ncbi:uncharacterized protein LOC130785082 isoform X3 [Actinidia eriantha]|uniref:uncharacterized protein LOC130785082 isoform X3 n=1 Tax=Actinidia eriantha TaxID=165200 RepID=UPI00258F99A2|nr:uncharacterized protein LOC130785082 isoform X3 [Actinidia eriantha]XP_057501153.1 uncharacterized protein LOC130785082 isoform X3 [Actinidia eriantha]XP_057501160.1 uncharacterized protein LOC130785082 isoform X3 [Actinidia eriantha]
MVVSSQLLVATMLRSDFLTIATTRPETLFADTAIAVNSQDECYSKYIGRQSIVPMTFGRRVAIISDKLQGSFTQGRLPSLALQSQIRDWSAILMTEERDPERPRIVWPISSNAMDCMGEREGIEEWREREKEREREAEGRRRRRHTWSKTDPPDLNVDKDFGAGVLKISPGHDRNDDLVARKLGLPILDVVCLMRSQDLTGTAPASAPSMAVMPTSMISFALDESPSTPPNAVSPSFRYRFSHRVHEERENTAEGTMERNTPLRKPHTSTADLVTWSEDPAAAPRARSHQEGTMERNPHTSTADLLTCSKNPTAAPGARSHQRASYYRGVGRSRSCTTKKKVCFSSIRKHLFVYWFNGNDFFATCDS